MSNQNPTVQVLADLLISSPELQENPSREVREMSLSLTYSERLEVLHKLREAKYPQPWPSAKIYRGSYKLGEPDPFND